MLLVLSINFYFHCNIWGCMFNWPIQVRRLKGYIYSSCYYKHQIGSIHRSRCFHISSVALCLRCLLHHILSLIVYTFRENWEFVFISIVQFMMSANSRIRFGLLIVFVCLYITPSHYHHCANFIWRHWNYKIVECVSKIKHILPVIHYTICGAVCVCLPISFVMIERIYIICLIIIINSEVWTITHCLGLGHETVVCAVCLSLFLQSCRRTRTHGPVDGSLDCISLILLSTGQGYK